MAQAAPSSAYDPEKFGSGNMPALGKYHVIVIKSEEPDAKGTCLVEYQVLAGTTPKQEGKTIQDRYFPFNEKAADRLNHLWYITKTATLAQIQAGEDIPMSSVLGKQLLIEVSMGKPRTGADGTQYPARAQVGWRPEAVECMANGWDAVPRHQGALKGELDFTDTPTGPGAGGEAGGDLFDFGG